MPVHLGSMAFAMADVVGELDWQVGDMLVLNDPFLGGTHLPDVTLISPVFVENEIIGYVANRAHHANIGCETPGSMPISSTLEEEGIIIPPTWLLRNGKLQQEAMHLPGVVDDELTGDFAAQAGANQVGVLRLQQLVEKMDSVTYQSAMLQLNDYADRIAASTIKKLNPGRYYFEDYLDDDGWGTNKILLAIDLIIHEHEVELDLTGSSRMVAGYLNCPESVQSLIHI